MMSFDFEYYISLWVTLTYGLYVIWRLFLDIKKPNLIAPILAVYLLFFWVPLLLDFLVGLPSYSSKFYNFQVVSQNSTVCTIYNIYVLFTLIVFFRYFKKGCFYIDPSIVWGAVYKLRKYKNIFLSVCILPVFFLFLTENPSQHLLYRSLVTDYEIPDDPFYSLMLMSTVVVAMVGTILLVVEKLSPRKNMFFIFVILSFLFFSVFINGKRYIVAIILVFYGVFSYFLGINSRRKFVFNIVVVSFLFVLFLSFYGKNSRDNFDETYTSLRIDFGRDDVTKYSIYKAFVNTADPILDYPGQSVLFSLFFFIPRSIWLNKPYPYAVYFTSNLLGYNSNHGYLGWSMTTSLLEEFISNFSLLGFLSPFLYVYCLRWLKNKQVVLRFLGLFILIMSLVVQLSAINLLLIIFIFLMVLNKLKK